jgi:hypothetical protein
MVGFKWCSTDVEAQISCIGVEVGVSWSGEGKGEMRAELGGKMERAERTTL